MFKFAVRCERVWHSVHACVCDLVGGVKAGVGRHFVWWVCVPVWSAAVVSTVAGSGVPTFVDATGTAAGFNDVLGVTLDALGNIYVSDYGNRRIRKVSSASGMYSSCAR